MQNDIRERNILITLLFSNDNVLPLQLHFPEEVLISQTFAFCCTTRAETMVLALTKDAPLMWYVSIDCSISAKSHPHEPIIDDRILSIKDHRVKTNLHPKPN